MIDWTKCETDMECKEVLQKLATEKNIFSGEFIKAVLKINNIVEELKNVCEIIGLMDLYNKLNEICSYENQKDNEIKILLSCAVKEINNIKVDGIEMVSFGYDVDNAYDRMKRDLLNMSIFAYCEKLYIRTITWSNYQTLGLMHNMGGKSYEEFIERV